MELPIETIDDVLPYIREGSGIIVSTRRDHTVIDYVFSTEETFDSAMALQCRGLKFDADGRIIGRPFHKFFNIGEREDPHQIDWSQPHRVTDKLDGSMVHAALLNGELVFMTRMGVTEQSRQAQQLASDGELRFCRERLAAGQTPIFEYTGPDNRVVVAYEEPQLTLLAVRDMVSGRYLAHDELVSLGTERALSVVETFASMDDIKRFMATARDREGAEGFVIAFDDGHRLKLKADGYVLRHRALASVHLEKNVLAWVATQAIDDVVPLLSPDIAARVLEYQSAVEGGIKVCSDRIEDFHNAHRHLSRKDYARTVQDKLPKPMRSIAFARLDGKSVRDGLLAQLNWASGSQARIDDVRSCYGFGWSTKGLTVPELG